MRLIFSPPGNIIVFCFLGIAFLFLRLMDTIYKNGEYRESLVNAVKLVYQSSRKALRGKKISFLCGDAGKVCLFAS